MATECVPGGPLGPLHPHAAWWAQQLPGLLMAFSEKWSRRQGSGPTLGEQLGFRESKRSSVCLARTPCVHVLPAPGSESCAGLFIQPARITEGRVSASLWC